MGTNNVEGMTPEYQTQKVQQDSWFDLRLFALQLSLLSS
jgi:hypothetical protein